MLVTNRNGVRRWRTSASHQRGMTLLESLVSIVVLAVGVLGLLGVQMRTLADTQTSVRRSQAIRLIEDLSERVKSNPGAYAELDSYVAPWGDMQGTAPAATACISAAAACTSAELAAHDIWQWKANVKQMLPLGDAIVFVSPDETDPNNKRQLGVMVGWRQNEKETGNSTDDTAYTAPFKTSVASVAAATCPDGLICHLVYVQP